MELKEAEQKSLKESERLEKEIVDVQEISVSTSIYLIQSSIDVYFCQLKILMYDSLSFMCWRDQKKLSTMTADEYFEKHSELKKKFDDEIRNDYWGY